MEEMIACTRKNDTIEIDLRGDKSLAALQVICIGVLAHTGF